MKYSSNLLLPKSFSSLYILYHQSMTGGVKRYEMCSNSEWLEPRSGEHATSL